MKKENRKIASEKRKSRPNSNIPDESKLFMDSSSDKDSDLYLNSDPADATRILDAPVARRRSTPLEEFRVWMHSAKGWIYAFLLVAIISPYHVLLLEEDSCTTEQVLQSYFAQNSPSGSDVAYRIHDFRRGKLDLRKTYTALRSMNPGSLPANSPRGSGEQTARFGKQEFNIDLLARAAMRKDLFQDATFRRYLRHSMRKAVSGAYVLYTLPENISRDLSKNAGEFSHEGIRGQLKKKMGHRWEGQSARIKERLTIQRQLQKLGQIIQFHREMLIQNERKNSSVAATY